MGQQELTQCQIILRFSTLRVVISDFSLESVFTLVQMLKQEVIWGRFYQ